MGITEMFQLIRQVWSDSMSDNGAIWERSNAELQNAKANYPDLYEEALAMAYEASVNQR
jgi:hypothetical protein